MAGLYSSIETDVIALFNATWAHPTIPVYWRANDADPRPDPSAVPHFLRNEILQGIERLVAFGAGRAANEKIHFGVVHLIGFASRSVGNDTTLLDLLWDASQTLRSQRIVGSFASGSSLNFIGDSSAVDLASPEDGGWFVRGYRLFFEYRFRG